MTRHRSLVVAVIFGFMLAAACGNDGTPAASTPTPTPTPVPTPTPTPTPTPEASFACGAEVVAGGGRCVEDGAPAFAQEIENAIDVSIATSGGVAGTRVTSHGRYAMGVLAALQAKGFCADYDGEEVQIKRNNDFHEQYDIILASGFVRRGPGAYRTKCTPAAFPTPAPPIFPVGGCTIGASRQKACGRDDDGGLFLAAVDAAINSAKAKNPGNYDGERVKDGEVYQNDVVVALFAAGFCARTDFEEVGVKNTNTFSEQYDILLANGTIRRGSGSYRVSCFPALF